MPASRHFLGPHAVMLVSTILRCLLLCSQANLREKTKQMKAMASELNMYQAQVRLRKEVGL
eukprot:scaffold252477_cov16-Tisochrysis_lutea.AAC.1